jgi:hypothetical protein
MIDTTTDADTAPTPAGADRPVEVSAVMPCFNEARTVAGCVRGALSYFAAAGISGEVVVADNGSSDGSQARTSETRRLPSAP